MTIIITKEVSTIIFFKIKVYFYQFTWCNPIKTVVIFWK